MIVLEKSARAWKTPAFSETFKEEFQQLDAQLLPLQSGLSQSSYVSDKPFNVIVLSVAEETGSLCVRVGVFYTGLIPGCACADDPTPEDEYTEYCEVFVEIDRKTTEATIRPVPES